jgi:transcriptional regulator with XRE-family HTH domain
MTNWKERRDNSKLPLEELEIIDLLIKLISLRESQGITQRALASKIGMTQAQLAKIESLTSFPTLKTLNRIASGLNASISLELVENQITM